MITQLLLLTASIVPQSEVIEDHVDVIEVNNFHDYEGRCTFQQLVFWNWNYAKSRHDVVAWRMLKSESMRPRRKGDDFVCMWRDQMDGDAMRRVIGKSFRETWTQYDVEIEAREKLPHDKRKGLSKPLREPVMDSTIRTNFIR